MTSLAIVGYLTLFAGTAIVFLIVTLGLGRLFRPAAPSPGKLESYECGEPAVGSAFVQFDLRFYVVALVFIVFEVEVAFFFPWAAVYGKLATLMNPAANAQWVDADCRQLAGAPAPADSATTAAVPAVEVPQATVSHFALAAMADMAVFFGVLLVGFAYLWNRGDLNWVRAVRSVSPAETDADASEEAAA